MDRPRSRARLRAPVVAQPGAGVQPRSPGLPPGAGRPVGGRLLRRWVALSILGLLVVAALILTGAIVGLANLGLSAASRSAADSSLAVPAPPVAGGLPRHYQPVRDLGTQALITEFIKRFSGVVKGYSGQPAALYREPGTVDLATNQPGWVMYLGFNSATGLGRPSTTIDQIMANLIENSDPRSAWVAAPGARGGSARCAIALFVNTTVSLCAWATDHTVGALMSPTADTRGNELAVLMPLMRLDLQPG